MSAALPAEFAPLGGLRLARQGAGKYYVPLLRSDDETIRFGAWCQLLSLEAAPLERYREVLALCHHPAIRDRAFEFFRAKSALDLAEEAAKVTTDDPGPAQSTSMLAELANDYATAHVAQLEIYRTTGEVRDLLRAARFADRAAGWRGALPWYVRAVALAPLDMFIAAELYRLLADANQAETIKALAAIFAGAGLHPYANAVFLAAAKLIEGDASGALQMVGSVKAPEQARGVRDVRAYSLKVMGEAFDKVGNYRASFQSYLEMNRLERTPAIDPKAMTTRITRLGAMTVPELPPARDDVVMMLGFPRSGTTLLEVVLDSHPDIEAIEESATFDAAVAYLARTYRSGESDGLNTQAVFAKVREIYFRGVDGQRRKDKVKLTVDKYPMRTIYAKILKSLLPDQRYIFCVRHPFDVVLSGFRQRFNANPAMEALREWPTAIELYDFTMSQWFHVHTLDDPKVHYLRYDRLVEDFEPTMRETLDFLGIEWDERVRSFAEEANTKSALTPSYQKIRRGLAMGVQTYWRNYNFLFTDRTAAPLRKWAEHFGFSTT